MIVVPLQILFRPCDTDFFHFQTRNPPHPAGSMVAKRSVARFLSRRSRVGKGRGGMVWKKMAYTWWFCEWVDVIPQVPFHENHCWYAFFFQKTLGFKIWIISNLNTWNPGWLIKWVTRKWYLLLGFAKSRWIHPVLTNQWGLACGFAGCA